MAFWDPPSGSKDLRWVKKVRNCTNVTDKFRRYVPDRCQVVAAELQVLQRRRRLERAVENSFDFVVVEL